MLPPGLCICVAARPSLQGIAVGHAVASIDGTLCYVRFQLLATVTDEVEWLCHIIPN